MRIHMKHADHAIRQRIEVAKQESFRTYEVCGQPGNLREGGWIKTLCDEHASAHGDKHTSAHGERQGCPEFERE